MGLLGISEQIGAGLHTPSSPLLDHGDLSWNPRKGGMHMGLETNASWVLAGPEGTGPSTSSKTHAVSLSTSRKEPSSGHLWHSRPWQFPVRG